MNKSRRLLACALGACAISLLASNAFGQANKFYVKFDLGGSIAEDVDLEEFFGESVAGGDVELEPGFRFGIAGGFWVTDWFAPELEFGGVMNSIDRFGGSSAVDATFSQFPLMVNAKFQLPNRSIVTPYAGAGVGFSTAVLSADYMQLGNTYLDGSEADMVFCWQAFAGIRFALAEDIGLSLEYRFLAADGPSWESDYSFNTITDRIRFGESKVQSLSIAFDFRF
jgi:opacity protein-like surface antigen